MSKIIIESTKGKTLEQLETRLLELDTKLLELGYELLVKSPVFRSYDKLDDNDYGNQLYVGSDGLITLWCNNGDYYGETIEPTMLDIPINIRLVARIIPIIMNAIEEIK